MPQGNYIGVQSIYKAGNSQQAYLPKGPTAVYGRVYDVLLTDDAQLADNMRVPKGAIGAIQFRFIHNSNVDENSPTQTALHLDPNNRKFPIVNEIVEIVSGPTTSSTDGKGSTIPVFYYKSFVDVWGSAEHNSVPTDNFDGPPTGNNFTEKGGIVRLQHLPGDIIQEGRFGNSVRIGSSNKSIPNVPWVGPDGSPVYIIRNGQRSNIPSGSTITIEDINLDGGSLYFLSDQAIGFIPANLNFDSYYQDVDSVVKNNVIKPILKVNNDTFTSSLASDIPLAYTTDSIPITYSTQTQQTSGSASDEIVFLPDKEAPVFYQELEDDVARHVTGDNSNWFKGINSDSVSTDDALGQSYLSGFSPYFIAYMQHQQGSSGLKKILSAAKMGYPSVPITWKSNYDSQGNCLNINWNMYGYRVNAPGFKSSNVGDDFNTVFGSKYTPGNFIKYWKSRFYKMTNKALSLKPSLTVNNALLKYSSMYGVPIDFVKSVCSIESSFNPNESNGNYKGLFQISIEEFHKVYPDDYNITDIDKNTNVGVRLLKNRLASVNDILNSIK